MYKASAQAAEAFRYHIRSLLFWPPSVCRRVAFRSLHLASKQPLSRRAVPERTELPSTVCYKVLAAHGRAAITLGFGGAARKKFASVVMARLATCCPWYGRIEGEPEHGGPHDTNE